MINEIYSKARIIGIKISAFNKKHSKKGRSAKEEHLQITMAITIISHCVPCERRRIA